MSSVGTERAARARPRGKWEKAKWARAGLGNAPNRGREGEGVVAEGGGVGGLFTSEAIGVLWADEAGEDALAEGGPGGHGEDFAAEVDG